MRVTVTATTRSMPVSNATVELPITALAPLRVLHHAPQTRMIPAMPAVAAAVAVAERFLVLMRLTTVFLSGRAVSVHAQDCARRATAPAD